MSDEIPNETPDEDSVSTVLRRNRYIFFIVIFLLCVGWRLLYKGIYIVDYKSYATYPSWGERDGKFVPWIYPPWSHDVRTILPPIIYRQENYALGYLCVYPSYHDYPENKDVVEVIIDRFHVRSKTQGIEVLISKVNPVEQRTYKISESESKSTHCSIGEFPFTNHKEDITVILEGQALDKDGEQSPFRYQHKYFYSEGWRFEMPISQLQHYLTGP